MENKGTEDDLFDRLNVSTVHHTIMVKLKANSRRDICDPNFTYVLGVGSS